MSRRDTIIVAVLINVGLLSILFATALNTDREGSADARHVAYELSQPKKHPPGQAPVARMAPPKRAPRPQPVRPEPKPVVQAAPREPEAPQPLRALTQKPVEKPAPAPSKGMEVTVKAGDSLDRIARANGTTVAALKTHNGLQTSTLQIGQTLRIPQGATPKPQVKPAPKPAEAFYTVQKGDNPWAIAKKHGVSLKELLSLNQLDEEKARRLKPGDKLRIR